MPSPPTRSRAALSLAMLIPAPTIGVLSTVFFLPGTTLGQAIYVLCKVWLLALPAVWHLLIEKQPMSWLPPKRGGFLFGVGSGAVISIAIVAAYLAVGRHAMDPAHLANRAAGFGLTTPSRLIAGGLYAATLNAVLEEYVWRWFVVQQFARLVSSRTAVALSAAAFTLHHAVALVAYLPLGSALLASLGVAVGGMIWSWSYVRYESIWPGYVSHAMADIAIIAIGYVVIFQ